MVLSRLLSGGIDEMSDCGGRYLEDASLLSLTNSISSGGRRRDGVSSAADVTELTLNSSSPRSERSFERVGVLRDMRLV
jgi:hypothetical protein